MPLANPLEARIEATGGLTVAEFMEYALYDPVYGYYHRKVPIGQKGDYITAPEMTQAFGEIIAVWLIDAWQKAGCPTPFHLVEMGPGRGTLMADILRTFQSLNMPMTQMAVHLVEVSPIFKNLQQDALSPFPAPVYWHKDMSTLPEGQGFCLMVANEFWDALPIQQFAKAGENWVERRIGKDRNTTDQLAFLPQEATAIREACTSMPSLVSQIAHHLGQNRGVALFLDYGHNQEDAVGDTLQAVQRHQFQNPLANIGETDLTHHVDFFRLSTLFKSSGLTLYGPTPQGNFLKAMGLDIRTENLCKRATPEQRGALRTAAVRLTHPAHMGALFKAMSVTSDPYLSPGGFDIETLQKAISASSST